MYQVGNHGNPAPWDQRERERQVSSMHLWGTPQWSWMPAFYTETGEMLLAVPGGQWVFRVLQIVMAAWACLLGSRGGSCAG